MPRPGESAGSSLPPGRDGSRRSRQTDGRVTVIGGSGDGGSRSMAPTSLPPFRTVAPPGHAMPQPREVSFIGAATQPPAFSTSQPSRTQTSLSRSSGSHSQSASRTQAPADMSRLTQTMQSTRLSTLAEQPEGTRTAGPRATTLPPFRGTAFDVADHGVFESDSEDEDEGTALPTRVGGMDPRSPSGATDPRSLGRGTSTGTRQPSSTLPSSRQPGTATGRTVRGATSTGRTRQPEDPAWSFSRVGSAVGGTSRRTRASESTLPGSSRAGTSSRAPTTSARTSGRTTVRPSGLPQTSYPPPEDADAYEADEDESEANDPKPSTVIRAQSQWYDPRNPPRPQPPGFRDQNLIYPIESDDSEVFRYAIPNDRADGGLQLLEEIDRRARHLRDPHFSALELWTRAYNSGFLRKIAADDDGYAYWTIENHNYDVAWACAQQGWLILGTGVGKDKGNFFMEQKLER